MPAWRWWLLSVLVPAVLAVPDPGHAAPRSTTAPPPTTTAGEQARSVSAAAPGLIVADGERRPVPDLDRRDRRDSRDERDRRDQRDRRDHHPRDAFVALLIAAIIAALLVCRKKPA